jgi:hypothetical protein
MPSSAKRRRCPETCSREQRRISSVKVVTRKAVNCTLTPCDPLRIVVEQLTSRSLGCWVGELPGVIRDS